MKKLSFLAALLLCCASAFSSPVGIIAHYKFDESSGTTAADSFGGVNGTLSGSTSFVAGGVSGNAISINNTNNGFVNMGDNFAFTSGSFSIMSWVKVADADTTGYIPVGKHHATTNAGYFLAVNNVNDVLGSAGNNKAHFYDSGPTSGASTSTINNGVWHQLVGIYDNSTNMASIAVDGAIQTSAASTTIVNISAPFMVGGIESSSSVLVNDFTGLIDDVQIYNFALTADNVSYLNSHPGQELPEPAALSIITLAGFGLLKRSR